MKRLHWSPVKSITNTVWEAVCAEGADVEYDVGDFESSFSSKAQPKAAPTEADAEARAKKEEEERWTQLLGRKRCYQVEIGVARLPKAGPLQDHREHREEGTDEPGDHDRDEQSHLVPANVHAAYRGFYRAVLNMDVVALSLDGVLRAALLVQIFFVVCFVLFLLLVQPCRAHMQPVHK